jgi:hypothetical protein
LKALDQDDLSFVFFCHGPASVAIGAALTIEGSWNGLPSIGTMAARVGAAAATNIAIAISSGRLASTGHGFAERPRPLR